VSQKKCLVVLSVTAGLLLCVSLPAPAADSFDFGEKLAEINAAGFILLAEEGDRTEVVETADEFEALISGSKPPDFYLLHKKTDKKSEVEITYGTKKHPGEYVWEFYQWLVEQFED